jgi:hypothetical protein
MTGIMMEVVIIERLNRLYRVLKLPTVNHLSGMDELLPLIEQIRRDGSVFVFKVDGERDPSQQHPYTLIVSGRKLKDEGIRADAFDLLEGVVNVIVEYGERFWLKG